LNAVFGARLRITALRAGSGPGIEFLEYLAPRDGRPYPTDSRASDLWQWQTRLRTAELERVSHARLKLVSPGPVRVPDRPLGFRAGLLARDPDGHAVAFVE
jgi:hypothetical protein